MKNRISQWANAFGAAALALAWIAVAGAAGGAAFTLLTNIVTIDPIFIMAAAVIFGQLHYLLIGWISRISRDRKAFNWASLIPNIAVSYLFLVWALEFAGLQVLEATAEIYGLGALTMFLTALSLTHLTTAGLWLAIYTRANPPKADVFYVHGEPPPPHPFKKESGREPASAAAEQTFKEKRPTVPDPKEKPTSKLPPKGQRRIWVPGDDN